MEHSWSVAAATKSSRKVAVSLADKLTLCLSGKSTDRLMLALPDQINIKKINIKKLNGQ